MTHKEKILTIASDLSLEPIFKFIPFSQSRHKNSKIKYLNWEVTLLRNKNPILTIDYSMGIAYCPSYKNSRTMYVVERINKEIECGFKVVGEHFMAPTKNQILPEFADVLHCIIIDSTAINYPTFEEWADSFGYETDSISAEKIYKQCLETGLKIRAAIGESGLQRLLEACENY